MTWRDNCWPGGKKICWPHLRFCYLSRGGPGGHCRYPADQVTPHTGLNPRRGRRTATCPIAPNLTSLLGRAPVLLRVPRLRILPPYLGGLWRCHVSRGFGSCLPVWEGSSAATCPATSDPTSLLGRAPTLPRVPRHQTQPPCSRGLRRCHVSCGSLWATNLKNKESLSWPTYVTRLTCLQDMPARYRDA
jgi:hypothetical protein